MSLSCIGLLPPATACSFSPSTVTPAANGSVSSTLTVTVGQATAGPRAISVQGQAGLIFKRTSLMLNLTGQTGAAPALEGFRRATGYRPRARDVMLRRPGGAA